MCSLQALLPGYLLPHMLGKRFSTTLGPFWGLHFLGGLLHFALVCLRQSVNPGLAMCRHSAMRLAPTWPLAGHSAGLSSQDKILDIQPGLPGALKLVTLPPIQVWTIFSLSSGRKTATRAEVADVNGHVPTFWGHHSGIHQQPA